MLCAIVELWFLTKSGVKSYDISTIAISTETKGENIMKRKAFKKLMSTVLVGAMLMGTLVGCGTEPAGTSETSVKETTTTESVAAPTEAEPAVEVTYPIDTDVTLTVALVSEANITAHYAGMSETPFWKALQEQTGVTLEVVELTTEALNMLLVSGDLPDMIFDWSPYSYSGGPEMAIADKVVAPITDYVEYAPDLMAALESNEDWWKTTTTSAGDVIGAPFIRGDEFLQTSMGVILRADWLEELNLEVPETPDEFYNVLKAFKEEKGAVVPFSAGYDISAGLRRRMEFFSGAFGLVSPQLYQVDGTVHFGFAEPELKDVLTYLNKLYSEGLLDPDFATIGSSDMKNNILSGRAGATIGACGGGLGTWLKQMKDDPTYDLVGVGSLVANKGDKAISGTAVFAIPGQMFVMTSACEHPEIAVQVMNYGYTEAGSLLYNFGVEGESYTMENGVPTYTEWVTNNADGWSMAQALAAYTRSWQHGPMVQDKGYMEQYAALPQQQAALTEWMDNSMVDHLMPTMTIATEDSAEYSKINSEIKTYIDSMMIAYITGAKSLDTFETEYLATLESLGVDRLIEIQQEALDAYNAK